MKTKFEEVIDAMMASEVRQKWPQLTDIINRSLTREEKRQAILAVLDNDRQLFVRLNREIGTNTRIKHSERIAKVVEMLREYVKVGETERKLYGEVMTPIPLVEKMLDQLPKEVWTNPNLKWLDPANGCGIFPAIIVQRLMKGLAGEIPDEEKRYAHIIKKMIHVCELQPKNMFLYLCAFDPKDKYDGMNIFTGSFIDSELYERGAFGRHAKEIWGVDQFDIIIGNPPYQRESENGKKTHPIWDQFVLWALYYLKPTGYLTFVHPAGWRAIDGRFKPTQELLKSRRMLALSINDTEAGMKTFGACTRFDFYTVQNTPSDGHQTSVTWQDGTKSSINLEKLEFIPNGKFQEIEQLVAKNDEPKVEILHSYSAYETRKPHISREQQGEFQFPCVENVGVKGIPTKIYYSNTKDNGHFGVTKLITSRFGINTFLDTKGEFGMTQDSFGIIEHPKNLEGLKKALLSPRFKALNKMTDVNGMRDIALNRKILALFRHDFWKEFIND